MKWRSLMSLAVLVLMGFFFWSMFSPAEAPLSETPAESQEPKGSWQEPVVQVVQQVGPATVKIETTREVLVDQFFFQQLERRQGIGSGVIYREDGYILTNNHVVAGAEDIRVQLADGRSFAGRVVGGDPLTDLAVVKVEAQNLPVAPFGDSNELRVGQGVIAIGNPLGQDNTVTTGVVSALNRDLMVDPKENRYLEGMIQTDAAINPGNSGGPLIDYQGRVIGVTTAIIEQAQGIGFAIPSTTAKAIGDQIISHGRPLRLGVLGGSLTPALAQSIREQTGLRISAERGAFITRVIPDTPAAAAGLAEGDIITAVNGQEIAGMRELRDAVQQAGFGGKLQLVFWRGEARQEVEVVL
ncbi:MAG TPA: trypsin-like peptidase domain-containing protein [Limnochordia bacterium]|nr:trypsin-like peptidase domain-containing protein [Limnochordia bacterium]